MPALLLVLLFTLAPAEAATKNIMLTGYWPPTNKMLRELSPRSPAWKGKNWRGSGYDVYAYFPERTEETGGVGEGDFRVDFAAVFNDFFRVTEELKPVAILSFGAGEGPWEIEGVYHPHFAEWFRTGRIPSVVGERVRFPIPASLAEPVVRRSTLPLEEIREAVASLGASGLRPWIDTDGGAGDYVCAFTGYLESWYQEQHSDPRDPAHVKAAGFIHVNGSEAKAEASMLATLEALVRSLR
jgi:hypothetical protein